MRQEIRLWEIGSNEELHECSAADLDLESRLEDWLLQDIALVVPELLVIDRQAPYEQRRQPISRPPPVP